MKKCAKCGVEKPLDEFHKRPSRPCGFVSRCKACVKGYNAGQYRANREQRIAAAVTWREKNPERYLAIARKSNTKRYYRDLAKSRLLKRMANQRRRARMRGNGVFTISPRDQHRLERSSCAMCGARDNLHVDHIVPIAKGGTHGIGNLQVLCSTCNRSKGAKLLIEFRTSARCAAVA